MEEALRAEAIAELAGYRKLAREVSYGKENSKIDFLLTDDQQANCYIDVKSCTLLDSKATNGQGYFPDAVTTRGQKHLRELMEIAESGQRAVLLFAVMHSGIRKVSAADHIDLVYAQTLQRAIAAGVEVIAYKATLSEQALTLGDKIPFIPTNSIR